ncbi:MAG: roadblock/LC7 domain-containing protein [Dermatophilaceae bacterium]
MTTDRSRWGYLLDQLCDTRGVTHAVAVSSDGMRVASSKGLTADAGDQIAAFTSGLESLTRGIAGLMQADPVEQTIVEMAGGHLVIMAIGDGSILTVLAHKDADVGQVAYEMVMLINRVGAALTPDVRTAPHG